jgi:anti-sigma factor RsiW
MRLCESIDFLAMALLDGELAPEEVREFESHLAECAACRTQLEAARAEAHLIRAALAAPPTPEVVRTRLARSLDAEDRATSHDRRKWWSVSLLPGSAIAAAAAAILMFAFGMRASNQRSGVVAEQAVSQQLRALPLEVQGASTGPWLQQNFASSIAVPRVDQPGSRLLGARLLPHGISGHDAALLSYQGSLNGGTFRMWVLIVRDVRDDEMSDGAEVQFNGRIVRVIEKEGHVMVTTVDGNGRGYVFMAPDLSTKELVSLVTQTSLVDP